MNFSSARRSIGPHAAPKLPYGLDKFAINLPVIVSADKNGPTPTDGRLTSGNIVTNELERFASRKSSGTEICMTFTVGEKVFYPGRGPCLIGAVVKKVVCGTSTSFYRLAPLDDSTAELFVPVDRLRDLPMRALLDRSEIPKLLRHLKPRSGVPKDAGTFKNWRQREVENAKLFSSGSVFDLAHLVESLTQLSGSKTLAPHERETLYRAKKLLICEISEVMDESKAAAEARIDSVLEPNKNTMSESPD